jgi:hypothetical protein
VNLVLVSSVKDSTRVHNSFSWIKCCDPRADIAANI